MRRPCCEKKEINKGAWSKQEDQKLIDYIHSHGEGCWRSLPNSAGLLRCGKSCRLRWINYLRPNVKRGNFSGDEEDLIIKLHALLGNRWSLIAGRLPGRTDNEIKNYWNSHLRRKLLKMGVDPSNHRLSHTHPQSNYYNKHHDLQIFSRKSELEVSDARSSLENDYSSLALPDLNLDLVACSSRGVSNDNIELLKLKSQNEFYNQNTEKVVDSSTPTLHLFKS